MLLCPAELIFDRCRKLYFFSIPSSFVGCSAHARFCYRVYCVLGWWFRIFNPKHNNKYIHKLVKSQITNPNDKSCKFIQDMWRIMHTVALNYPALQEDLEDVLGSPLDLLAGLSLGRPGRGPMLPWQMQECPTGFRSKPF